MAETNIPTASNSTFGGALQRYAYETPASSYLPLRRVTRSSSKADSATPSPSPSERKRKSSAGSVDSGTVATSSPSRIPKKTKRSSSSYAPPSKYAAICNNLVDALTPGLICIFIGVNPGIRTATLGHAYSHPSNLFWKLLHSSGCTPRRCAPEEDRELPALYELGHTNIVSRPTKDAAELSKQEMDDGVAILEEKIKLYKPEGVAIVGKGIWESIWRVKHGRPIKKEEFKYGWQDEVWCAEDGWEGARVFVTCTTSGLGASTRPHEKEEIWRPLGEWVARRRLERKTERESIKHEKTEVALKNEDAAGIAAEVRGLVTAQIGSEVSGFAMAKQEISSPSMNDETAY